MEKLVGFWCVIVAGILCSTIVESLENEEGLSGKQRNVSMSSEFGIGEADAAAAPTPLMVPLTLINGAAANGAVCLDGTLPGYYLSRGFGSGENSWLVQLEGGGWCNNVRSCVMRKKTNHGSSNYFEKEAQFTGILSNKRQENPDFYNWNRVKIAYCDGASFAGEGENKVADLQFRGQRIWMAAMKELMSRGMSHNVDQTLLTGCSAGGLATILHCDEFRGLFKSNTKVKCLSDAGLFMDAKDVSGGQTLRNFFNDVVTLQGVERNLPRNCTDRLDPTSCFFPQNLIANVKAPLFILNSAYDSWQVQRSLAPPSADPKGIWSRCSQNLDQCSESQLQFLRGFRGQMLKAIKSIATSRESGYFIKSFLVHCLSEIQSRWFAPHSPTIDGKAIATSVGDWYFDRATAKAIECRCPYDACPKTC